MKNFGSQLSSRRKTRRIRQTGISALTSLIEWPRSERSLLNVYVLPRYFLVLCWLTSMKLILPSMVALCPVFVWWSGFRLPFYFPRKFDSSNNITCLLLLVLVLGPITYLPLLILSCLGLFGILGCGLWPNTLIQFSYPHTHTHTHTHIHTHTYIYIYI